VGIISGILKFSEANFYEKILETFHAAKFGERKNAKNGEYFLFYRKRYFGQNIF